MAGTRYDGAGRVAVANDPEGNELVFAYDDNGNLIRVTEIEVTQRDAVAAGRLPELQETFTTLYVYDSLNRLIRSTDDLGQTMRYQYDSRDNLVLASDAQHSADPADLINDPLGLFPPSGLPSAGITRINRTGNTMEFFYDGARRRIAGVVRLRADGQGKNAVDLSNSSNPDGLVVMDYQWDANSRLIGIAEDGPPGNQNISIGLIERAEPRGNVTRFAYTALDRFARATFPDGSVLGYDYDAFNQLEKATDRNGSQIHFTYNDAGLVESLQVMPASSDDPHPLGGAKEQGASWQVIGTRSQTFAYDGLYRLIKLTDSDSPNPGDGDPDDGDPNARVMLLAYDSADHVVEEVQRRVVEEAGRVVSSCWDATDNRVLLVYPSGREIRFTHDRLRRIKTIRNSGASEPLVTYDYIGPERLARRDYQNGLTLAYVTGDDLAPQVGYDGVKRPVLHRHLLPTGTGVASFAYEYDRNSNKLVEAGQRDNARREAYHYDSAYRLVSLERASETSLSWQLDGMDNWISLNSSENQVNELNQYTSFDGSSLRYDTNGNLIDDGASVYQYDVFDRLHRVVRKSDDVVIASYRYDAQSRRTERVVSGTTGFDEEVECVYDGWQEIEDLQTDLVRQYVCGLGLDELLILDQTPVGGTATTSFYYHDDARSNIVALTDVQGAVVERYRYDPYGRPMIQDPTGASLPVSAVGNSMLFSARRYDPETGFYYFRHRYLHPLLGRFLTRDPMELSANLGNFGNSYTYLGDNPINGIDPLGLVLVQCNCKLACTTSGRETSCKRMCDLCDIGDGAGSVGEVGPGRIPGPGGGGSGGGGRPSPPPAPPPDQDREHKCHICDVQRANDEYKAHRNGRFAVWGAMGTGFSAGCGKGVIEGLAAGAAAGAAIGAAGGVAGAAGGGISGAIRGAVAGCLWQGGIGAAIGYSGGMLAGKMIEHQGLDDARRAYDICRESNRCP